MKTVSFTLSERVNALGLLNAFKGNLDKLSVILEDIKQFVITKEEWEAVDMQATDLGEGKQQMTWDNTKETEKEITLQEATVDYLRDEIKRKNEAGEFSVSDRSFITLKEKLA